MTELATLPLPATHPELPSFVGCWRIVEATLDGPTNPTGDHLDITSDGPGLYKLRLSGDSSLDATLHVDPSLRHLSGQTDASPSRDIVVSMWADVRRDRLVVACDGAQMVLGAERTSRRDPGWDVESFLLRRPGFRVVAERASGSQDNPKRSYVSFRKVVAGGLDGGLYDIYADNSTEPYDRLLYVGGCGALMSLFGWRQIAIQPTTDTAACLFAMFDEKAISQGADPLMRGRLMPFETRDSSEPEGGGDDIGVWGAEEG